MKSARQVLLLLLGLALANCAQPATNFSQFPGFAAYFATHPAREELGRFEATYARTGDPLDFVRVQAPVSGL